MISSNLLVLSALKCFHRGGGGAKAVVIGRCGPVSAIVYGHLEEVLWFEKDEIVFLVDENKLT